VIAAHGAGSIGGRAEEAVKRLRRVDYLRR